MMFSIFFRMAKKQKQTVFSTTELVSKGGLVDALKRVDEGLEVTITRYNLPVARITALPSSSVIDPLTNRGLMPVPTGAGISDA